MTGKSTKMSRSLLIILISLYTTSASTDDETSVGSPDVISACDSGWYSFREKCYKVEKDKLSWTKARDRCVEYGGDLASIHTQKHQEFISSYLLMDIRRNLWIGLHDRRSEDEYSWSDGSTFDYNYWATGEPTGYSNINEDCVEMFFQHPYSSSLGQWNDLDCNLERSFICQKGRTEMPRNSQPLDPRYCSPNKYGWKFQDSCIYIINERKSWEEAESFCATNYSGHLIAIKDVTVGIFLDFFLEDSSENYWIGLKSTANNQQIWSSGWQVSYSHWDHDNNFNSTCASRQAGGKWSTYSCLRKLPFICEISSVSPPVLTPSIKGSTCPDKPSDWRDLGGDFCYFFSTKDSLTWADANLKCMHRGGYLASIHSSDESYILQPFLKDASRVHIGLYRKTDNTGSESPSSETEDDFEDIFWSSFHRRSSRLIKRHDLEFAWADGTELNYANWGEDQPNGGNENCVDMCSKDMQWHDYGCNKRVGYICSVKKIPPTEISNDKNERNCSISPDKTVEDENIETFTISPDKIVEEETIETFTISPDETVEEETIETFTISPMKASRTENITCTSNISFLPLAVILFCTLIAMIGFNVYYFKPSIKVWFQRRYSLLLKSQNRENDQEPKTCSAKFTSQSLHPNLVQIDSTI